MALHEMYFDFKVDNPNTISKEWSHTGVVGSGDLEVLMEQKELNGAVKVKVVTPVTGFDKVWNMVLTKFVNERKLGNVSLEIYDNNATPIVVSMRLAQALTEANKIEQGVE